MLSHSKNVAQIWLHASQIEAGDIVRNCCMKVLVVVECAFPLFPIHATPFVINIIY